MSSRFRSHLAMPKQSFVFGKTLLALICLTLIGLPATAWSQNTQRRAAARALLGGATSANSTALKRVELQVDGVAREFLLYVPPAKEPNQANATEPALAPVVFGFHGHGGTMQNASRSFAMHEHWPEAIVVYMQGLNTPGRLTDPEGKKPGWQSRIGAMEDRDLKFFDAVWQYLKDHHPVDTKRVYSMGHSNGGGFTYLLWAARGDMFAAMAPSSAVPKAEDAVKMKPKPAFHVAGENDPLVKYDWQKVAIEKIKELNGCKGQTEEFGPGTTKFIGEQYPFVVLLHNQGHKFASDAPKLMVKFFKEHSL